MTHRHPGWYSFPWARAAETPGMANRLHTMTAILAKLLEVFYEQHGTGKEPLDYLTMMNRLRELDIGPDMPDDDIEKHLRKLVATGEFVKK